MLVQAVYMHHLHLLWQSHAQLAIANTDFGSANKSSKIKKYILVDFNFPEADYFTFFYLLDSPNILFSFSIYFQNVPNLTSPGNYYLVRLQDYQNIRKGREQFSKDKVQLTFSVEPKQKLELDGNIFQKIFYFHISEQLFYHVSQHIIYVCNDNIKYQVTQSCATPDCIVF